MAEPTVLLADEPTASLDPYARRRRLGLITDEAHRRGVATVIVTHDDAPLGHADRHLHLAGGALTDGGTVAS